MFTNDVERLSTLVNCTLAVIKNANDIDGCLPAGAGHTDERNDSRVLKFISNSNEFMTQLQAIHDSEENDRRQSSILSYLLGARIHRGDISDPIQRTEIITSFDELLGRPDCKWLFNNIPEAYTIMNRHRDRK